MERVKIERAEVGAAMKDAGVKRHGSYPGERRGGRAVGAKNVKTEANKQRVEVALRAAFRIYGYENVDKLSPAETMLMAMRGLLRAKMISHALVLAREVAPYCDAKIAPKAAEGAKDVVVEIKGGLPD